MLKLLPKYSFSLPFNQKLVTDPELVTRLCKNVCEVSYAYSRNQSCQLILYARNNGRLCWQEAGVIYTAGPVFRDVDLFPHKMLRLFCKELKACLDIVDPYYRDLINQQAFVLQK